MENPTISIQSSTIIPNLGFIMKIVSYAITFIAFFHVVAMAAPVNIAEGRTLPSIEIRNGDDDLMKRRERCHSNFCEPEIQPDVNRSHDGSKEQ
jgi:hypothetical protein